MKKHIENACVDRGFESCIRSPGGGNGNPLQYSCLENPIDIGPFSAIARGMQKSWTWVSNWAYTRIYVPRNAKCLQKTNISTICVRTTRTHLSLHEAGFLEVGLAIYTFNKFLGHAHQWEPQFGTSLVVHRLKNSLCNAVDVSLIPCWGTKIPQAVKQSVCHNYWACALEPASHN